MTLCRVSQRETSGCCPFWLAGVPSDCALTRWLLPVCSTWQVGLSLGLPLVARAGSALSSTCHNPTGWNLHENSLSLSDFVTSLPWFLHWCFYLPFRNMKMRQREVKRGKIYFLDHRVSQHHGFKQSLVAKLNLQHYPWTHVNAFIHS